MSAYQYSSADFYRVLETIEIKVRHLTTEDGARLGGLAYKDLLDYVTKEREACAVRVARAKAESARRKRVAEKETTSEDAP